MVPTIRPLYRTFSTFSLQVALAKMMKKRLTNVKSNKKEKRRPYRKRKLGEDGNIADSESESTQGSFHFYDNLIKITVFI